MLRRIGSYGRLFAKGGLSSIAMPDVTLHKGSHLDATIVKSARELADVTPQPRRVRVAGRLDLMGASQGVLKIHVASGAIVTAIWDGPEALEEFSSMFNKDVVCEGLGVFRPSGSLLRIDADAIAPASDKDNAFRYAPAAVARQDLTKAVRLRTGEPPVYTGFLGSIPAEESEQEFAAAVEALS
jgi:hypothetical protein